MTPSHSLHHMLLAAALTVSAFSVAPIAMAQETAVEVEVEVETGMLPHFSPQMGELSAGEFARTQSETQLLRARIDRTKAQVELATLQQQMNTILHGEPEESKKETTVEIEELPAPPVITPTPEEKPASDEVKADPNAIPAPPEVVAVFGAGNDLFASLRMYNGHTFDVKKGDRIQDGYRVQSITPEIVTLNRSGKTYQLRIISSHALGVNLHREIPLNLR